MRIWSIHPEYLDTKGLVAVWREGLLALHVLSGKTKGYTKHPQLRRFQDHSAPIHAISNYLHYIVDEADRRGFKFDRQKLLPKQEVSTITVTTQQVEYEARHLLKKLQMRDQKKWALVNQVEVFSVHPFFTLVEGPIADWEKMGVA